MSGKKPISPTITSTDMRWINRAAILDLIRTNGPISRTEVAAQLQISLPTVMRIVDELIAEGLVRDANRKAWSGGRKRTLIEFNGSESVIVGIDLGGTKLFGAVADLNGNILEEMHFTHHQTTAEESFLELKRAIDTLIAAAERTGCKLLGIGVGVPGITHPETGVVTMAPSLSWDEFPLKERLSALYSYPVAVENDVNLAALGELWFGTEADLYNLVLIAIGTGIGAGVIIDGVVYRGKHHMAGEIGYLLPDRLSLEQTYPGFGALEQKASGTGIAARARELLKGLRPAEELAALSAEDVFHAARRGEPWATAIVAETVDYLAQAVAAVTLLYDPDVILLGGGVARSADLLIQPILARLEGRIPWLPRLTASRLGYRAGVLGSIVTLLRMTANYYILHKFS